MFKWFQKQKKIENKTAEKLIFHYVYIRNFQIPKYRSFYISSVKILTPTLFYLYKLKRLKPKNW